MYMIMEDIDNSKPRGYHCSHAMTAKNTHMQSYTEVYHIVGNFHMVQNFTVFTDRSAAAKIRSTNFSSASYGLLVGVVSSEH